ncbi:MAG: CoA transferase [Rhizobacter sp.]|nr:CoA transferase [Burkholderiales bacterium]
MSKPLSGLRVLDLTRLLPGPACTRMLAEWGAEVVKIEPPEGDYANRLGLPLDAPPEQIAPLYSIVNRGKSFERLDLKSDSGRARLLALVANSDVLVEGFRPGVMARLGLDYVALREHNAALVYCAITGYGSVGPWALRAGHDINYLALSGVLDQVGERGRPPSLSNWQIADLAGGALAAAAHICAALVQAKATGVGSFVDVSMTHEVARLNIVAEHGLALDAAKPRGEDWLTGGWPCYGVYRTFDERFLAVGALEAKFWHGLCDALGKAHLKALGSSEGVVGLRVRKELADCFGAQPLAYWTEIFAALDCCVSPVLTLAEAKQHPLFKDFT